MNVRYLGTKLNKRQARGSQTGKRYTYSSQYPIFTIEDADHLQFRGETEGGQPKFEIIISDDVITLPWLASMSVAGIEARLEARPLGRAELDELMRIEVAGQNRLGAIGLIRHYLDA
jgi:hypothetical protein